jgi:TonB family protein
MKRILAFSLFLIAFLCPRGGVSGVMKEDMVWSGEVVVGSDLVIPSGVTLTIVSGTKVKFLPQEEPVRILVRGKLIARGQGEERILFTTTSFEPQMGDWWGIEFRSSDVGSVLENCRIEYGRYGVFCLASSPHLKGNTISHNLKGGVVCINRSSPTVEGCQIWGNGEEGILCKYLSPPKIERTEITANPYGIVILDRSCPYLGSLEEVGGNQIYGNSRYDIYNLSPLRIQAQGNLWKESRLSQIDRRIYDNEEDSSSGEVVFAPIKLFLDLAGGEMGSDQGESGPVAVGMLDSLPRVLEKPPLPSDLECRGEALVKALVDEEGKVWEVKVDRSNLDGDCERIALDLVAKWRFSPGIYQGKEVRFWTTIPVEFLGGKR